ncbi:MAG: DUF4476 domain-containing protein [Bacteroidia bacterium]
MYRWCPLVMLLSTLFAQSRKCYVPTYSEVNFSYLKIEIATQGIDSRRLSMVKEIVKAYNPCFSAEQVKDLLWTFEFEESRLEVLQLLAKRITNPPKDWKSYYEELFETPTHKKAFQKWAEKL